MLRLFYTDEKTDNCFFQRVQGWQPSYGWMLLHEKKDEIHIICFLDGRYFEKEVESKKKALAKRWGKKVLLEKVLLNKSFPELLRSVLRKGAKLHLEASMPYGVVESLKSAEILKEKKLSYIFDKDPWQTGLRMIKQDDELTHIKKAIQYTDEVRYYVQTLARKGDLLGMTELQLRSRIIHFALSLGLEGEAFETIVASGAHSAIPHHQTGKSIIGEGPLLVDMGFRREGWCSDFTRMLRLGGRQTKLKKEEYNSIYAIVKAAYDAALDATKPGVKASEIARIARSVIEDAGYGEFYTHSLGHGVGLDIHEAPRMSVKSTDILERNMVFTIEPGIYLPGKFGVRLENIVVLGEKKGIVYSKSDM